MKNKIIQRFFTILLGLVMVGTASAVNWGTIEFLGDGTGGDSYNNKYKVEKATGIQDIANVQHPTQATADAIYLSFISADFGELRINDTKMSYDQQGAGVWLHLSNFTAKETEVKVMNSGNTEVKWTFHVFYADGTGDAGGGDDPEPTAGIDWTKYSWVVDSNDKFKVGADASLGEQLPDQVVSVQKPSFAEKDGIYMTFPGAISSCTLNGGIQGGGICLYIDQFTAQETKVTVTYAGGTRTFTIYYADGTPAGGGGDTPDPEPTGNLFNAANASISTSFNNWDWAEDKTSTATYDAATGKVTANIDGAKNAQWQAQVKLNTGLTTLDATKKIYFTCKIKPNVTFNGTTIKMFDNAEIYYENQSVSLTADEESVIILSGKNAIATVDGIIVFDFGWAPANTTIEIYDIEIGYGEIEDDSKPSANPAAPSYPAEQVKAIYSDTYSADCTFGEWSGGTVYTQDTYGKRFTTTSNGYFGLEFSAKNCSNMEKLHMDVWFQEAGTFRVVPIWGGTEYGVTVTVTEAESKAWKSVDISFTQDDWANITDWSNIYQIKIDNAANETFWLNNIYFYTTQEQEPEDNSYCEKEVGHMFLDNPDSNSFILLSIGSDGEGHTIVNIKQDAAKNTQKFDYLQVSGLASTGADVETGGMTEMGIKFATPTPDANGEITLEILWSTVGWPGRWMVQNLKVPAAATCESAVIPEAPAAEVKTYYGYLKHEKGVYVGYSITRNEDNTLTFNANIDSETAIVSTQVMVEGTPLTLTKTDDSYSASTTTTFIQDQQLTNTRFYIVLDGAANVAEMPITYTVGASNDPITLPTEKVTLDKANLSFGLGDADQTLTARVYPNFATTTTITWTSNAEGVATVANGVVHPVAAGDATITATCGGKTATCAVNVASALEDASYYGTGFFKTPVDQSYVAYNYNFTRKANHEVILAVVFERDVTSYIEADNFQFYVNGVNHSLAYTAATKTATYSFGNKADGSEIVNFYFRFVLTGGGLGETSSFTYTVGSTNEQPNKLIALNEVIENTLTADEIVDAVIARTFTAGNLYTLALPFDMTADQVAETFGTCTMYNLAESYWKVQNENMYIRFAPVTEFEANTPILFTPTENIQNAVAKDVTIKNGDCKTPTELVTFHGTYSKMNLTESDYILAADQYLYPVVGENYSINGMRGYFSWGAGVSQAPKIARVILREEITTDNALVPAAQGSTKKVMENGRFVIIRDGKSYNAQGLIIQ